jgi:nucleoside phosphorylase
MAGELFVVASMAPDLAGLRSFLGEKLDGAVRGMTVRTKVIGLGHAAAAAATARGILAVAPRAVLLVGTCGVYPNLAQYRPLDVLVPSRLVLVDPMALQGRAEIPTPMVTRLDCAAMLVAGLNAGRPRPFAPSITSMTARISDDGLATSVASSTGCEADNPEAFAVATACQAGNVPFAAILGVSNLVGSVGLKDWQQFQRDAVTQAGNVLGAWLHAGAQGLPHG